MFFEARHTILVSMEAFWHEEPEKSQNFAFPLNFWSVNAKKHEKRPNLTFDSKLRENG